VSYGVNRAKKRTTRRKKRPRSNGRAQAAAKRKGRATSTKRATSARPARRKRAASSRTKARRSKSTGARRTTSKSSRTKKPKAPRLYTRYDPETGQKVRVPVDSYEYANWVSRKPSKKKQQRAALVSNPVGTVGTIALLAGRKAIERAGERAGRQALQRAAKWAPEAYAAAQAAGGATVVAAVSAAALVGGAIYAMGKLAEMHNVALGERANRITAAFAKTQDDVIAQATGRRPRSDAERAHLWQSVPSDLRTKLVKGYKDAIAKVYAFQPIQGTIRPSQQIPYGR
jgi:hypothetical protein